MNKKLLIFFYILFSCYGFTGLHAQEYAKPKSGEGVSAFLQRFGRNTAKHRKAFMELNRRKLTPDGGLILGRKYQLPPQQIKSGSAKASGKEKINEPLFGPNYAKFTVNSRKLNGACIYLVSGHGGPDPGAIGKVRKRELHEDEYAYDIVLRLARNLMMHGAKVHIIIQDAKDGIRNDRYLNNSERETCRGKSIPLNQTARLQQRCEAINRLSYKDKEKYKRALFVHVDSRGKGRQVDVFFYHSPGSTLGKRLANHIHETFDRKYEKHQPNRGFEGTVSERNLYVLRHANPVATFLELGNIQNEKDRKRLIIPSNRQALADWICQGIIRDYTHQ